MNLLTHPETLKVTPADLVPIFLEQEAKGAFPVTISTFSDVKAKKTDNPYESLFRLIHLNGLAGFNYQAAVERQQGREGQTPVFTLKPRAWGERISRCLVKHTKAGETEPQYYLSLMVRRTLGTPLYFARQGGFMQTVAKERILQFLPARKNDGANQGVEKPVVFRDMNLGNMRAVKVGGRTYQVT